MFISPVSISNSHNQKMQNNSISFSENKNSNEIKNSKKMTALVSTGVVLTTLGSVVALGVLAKKGKLGNNAKNIVDKIVKPKNNNNYDLKNVLKSKGINFKNGVATLENGSNYTGKICGKLKNGNNIELEYANGKIVRSTSEKFSKFFKYDTKGKLSEVCTKKQNVMPHYYFSNLSVADSRVKAGGYNWNKIDGERASYTIRMDDPNFSVFQAFDFSFKDAAGHDCIQIISNKKTNNPLYRGIVNFADKTNIRTENFYDKKGTLLAEHTLDSGDLKIGENKVLKGVLKSPNYQPEGLFATLFKFLNL